jgi:hypothetical protein
MINIYLICCTDVSGNKMHKIGFTKRTIERRIKEFKTGNANDFYLIDSFKSKWGTKIEAKLHKQFKSKRVNGEWFMLSDSDILEFGKICETLHEGFEFIANNNTYYQDRENINFL